MRVFCGSHYDGPVDCRKGSFLVGPLEPGSKYRDRSGDLRTCGPRLADGEVAICKEPGNGYNPAVYYIFNRGEAVSEEMVEKLLRYTRLFGRPAQVDDLRKEIVEMLGIS